MMRKKSKRYVVKSAIRQLDRNKEVRNFLTRMGENGKIQIQYILNNLHNGNFSNYSHIVCFGELPQYISSTEDYDWTVSYFMACRDDENHPFYSMGYNGVKYSKEQFYAVIALFYFGTIQNLELGHNPYTFAITAMRMVNDTAIKLNQAAENLQKKYPRQFKGISRVDIMEDFIKHEQQTIMKNMENS